MAQGGEFAFVLYAAATAVGILDAEANAILTAIIIFSMVLTPLLLVALRYLMPAEKQDLQEVDIAEGLTGSCPHHRLWPVRSDFLPTAADTGRRHLHHRQ